MDINTKIFINADEDKIECMTKLIGIGRFPNSANECELHEVSEFFDAYDSHKRDSFIISHNQTFHGSDNIKFNPDEHIHWKEYLAHFKPVKLTF